MEYAADMTCSPFLQAAVGRSGVELPCSGARVWRGSAGVAFIWLEGFWAYNFTVGFTGASLVSYSSFGNTNLWKVLSML
jgi:hypothetical protein